MKKIKLKILGLSSSVDTQTGSFALIKEEDGEKITYNNWNVWGSINCNEIEKIIPNRPVTHDSLNPYHQN